MSRHETTAQRYKVAKQLAEQLANGWTIELFDKYGNSEGPPAPVVLAIESGVWIKRTKRPKYYSFYELAKLVEVGRMLYTSATVETIEAKPEGLADVIAASDVAHVNKLTREECEELAGDIVAWFVSKAESAEHLFDIDKDEEEQVQAVRLTVIKP